MGLLTLLQACFLLAFENGATLLALSSDDSYDRRGTVTVWRGVITREVVQLHTYYIRN